MATARQDPTGTRAIEKRWSKEINRRWRSFTKRVLEPLIQETIVFNAFNADPSQIRIYMSFLETQIQALLLQTTQAPNWQAQYQLQSYEKALVDSRRLLRRQGADISLTIDELSQAQILTPAAFTATPSIGGVVNAPIHQDALSFLYTRSYEALKGHTDKMAREVRQILIDGVRDGSGIRDVRRNIVDRIGVSRTSAQRIAQTETIQAYQRSQINQAELESDIIGEDINLRWLTRRDGKVRDLHVRFHGQIMSQQEANANINISPFNCRCALVPVIEEADTKEDQEKFDKQRKQLIKQQSELNSEAT